MFTWAQAALLLLQVVKAIMARIDKAEAISSGVDKQIAKEASEIALMTAEARRISGEVDSMSDDTVLATIRKDLRD